VSAGLWDHGSGVSLPLERLSLPRGAIAAASASLSLVKRGPNGLILQTTRAAQYRLQIMGISFPYVSNMADTVSLCVPLSSTRQILTFLMDRSQNAAMNEQSGFAIDQ
jgi:hypothetical protein